VTDSPGAVIAGNITILAHSSQPSLDAPNWAGSGCPTNKAGILQADCSFPLGIDVSKTDKELSAKFPAVGDFFALKEVYHGNGLGRFVAMRMCKGDANKPSSIACTVGGDVAVGRFVADAVFKFDGNWSGAGSHTFNPSSGSNPFDIITPLFAGIENSATHPVTASANGGTPQPATGCNPMPSQGLLRCFFIARDLTPNGCSGHVIIVVRGNVFSLDPNRETPVKFESQDDPVCSK
jgi:hypothetical protein